MSIKTQTNWNGSEYVVTLDGAEGASFSDRIEAADFGVRAYVQTWESGAQAVFLNGVSKVRGGRLAVRYSTERTSLNQHSVYAWAV